MERARRGCGEGVKGARRGREAVFHSENENLPMKLMTNSICHTNSPRRRKYFQLFHNKSKNTLES